MRDLARRNYNAGGSAKYGFKIIAVVVVAFVLYFFLKNQTPVGSLSSSSVALHDAPKGLTPVDLPDNATDLGKGINLTSQKATFTNVSEGSARATATRRFGDGSYSLIVDATLPDPKNNRYQVWIIGDTPTDAGFMTGSGTTWTLTFRDKDYYSKFSQIWITREITDNEGKPERHILEGSF